MKKLLKVMAMILSLSLILSFTALAQPEGESEGTSAEGESIEEQASEGESAEGESGQGPGGPNDMGLTDGAVVVDGITAETKEEYFEGNATGTEVSDFNISFDNVQQAGIVVNAEEGADEISIHDGRIELLEKGTALSFTGASKIVVDNVVVWNKGGADGVSAAGQSETTVTNTVIYGEQNPETYRRASPFALGLAGSMRVTNAVENSKITYKDSLVVSGSWAPLSTDSGSDVCLTTENVLAGIGWLEPAEEGKEYTATKEVNGVLYGFTLGDSANYNSGYVSYCDSGFHNYYYDSQFFGTDYVIILSTALSSATMVNDDCYSDRIGIMWHKNAGGTVDMTGGSMYAKRCLFMMKGYSDLDTNGCFCNLIVDGTDLEVGEGGVLLEVMTSDDCGLNYEALQVPEVESDFSQVECLMGTQVQKTYSDGFPPTTYYVYELNGEEVGVTAEEMESFEAENPDAVKVMVDYEPQETSYATFKNLSVEGDVYNAVWQAYQKVDVTFDAAEITGIISSAWANHVDADGNVLEGGTVIPADSTLDCHLGVGRVVNTPAETVNNPVAVHLTNGAVWNVTGTSYVSELEVDETSTVNGVITETENGYIVTPE